jgi:hypothetical protein
MFIIEYIFIVNFICTQSSITINPLLLTLPLIYHTPEEEAAAALFGEGIGLTI